LQSSYKTYKADTNRFATWIFHAATKCGYELPGPASTTRSSKKGGRKRNHHRPTTLGPTGQTATIKDLQHLAKLTANSSITVPDHILSIARRAINLITKVTSWFLSQSDSDTSSRHWKISAKVSRRAATEVCSHPERQHKLMMSRPPSSCSTNLLRRRSRSLESPWSYNQQAPYPRKP
jgi:hypothetical protein